ncbi:MAG: cobalt ECF transporter T component CbiQ [Peptococcaceae bacterium]|nr:cobalt ECF transporter T component CbiQ [Peptococcaceae bacterium]
MINIDHLAYTSKLKNTDPRQKMLFALLTMGVCLWADSVVVSILVLLIMGWATVCQGGTRFSLFCKLLMVPMSFLILGVVAVAVDFSGNELIFIYSVALDKMYLGVTQAGLQNALHLFFKALGAVACLYYLSLSTPMIDVLAVFRRLKMPKLLVEMMGLIYRFIFVFLETADNMVTAQNSRLGYSGLSAGYRSLAALMSTLFIRAYKRADELYTALEARGYDGELNVVEETSPPYKWTGFLQTVGLNGLLVIFVLWMKEYGGGVVFW